MIRINDLYILDTVHCDGVYGLLYYQGKEGSSFHKRDWNIGHMMEFYIGSMDVDLAWRFWSLHNDWIPTDVLVRSIGYMAFSFSRSPPGEMDLHPHRFNGRVYR